MPITRNGINRIPKSPLAKASFEEMIEMLVEGAYKGERDNLLGVSEHVMLGKKPEFGRI